MLTNSTEIHCGLSESISTGCEMSNLITMQWELIIAFTGAIILALIFYFIEYVQRKKSDKLIKRATTTLEKIDPIIEEQEKIINSLYKKFDEETKKKQRRRVDFIHRKISELDTVIFHVSECRVDQNESMNPNASDYEKSGYWIDTIEYHFEKYWRYFEIFADLFDPSEINRLGTYNEQIQRGIKNLKEYFGNTQELEDIIQSFVDIREFLKNIDNKK